MFIYAKVLKCSQRINSNYQSTKSKTGKMLPLLCLLLPGEGFYGTKIKKINPKGVKRDKNGKNPEPLELFGIKFSQ